MLRLYAFRYNGASRNVYILMFVGFLEQSPTHCSISDVSLGKRGLFPLVKPFLHPAKFKISK